MTAGSGGKQVVVIGAGVIGLSTAWQAARAGHRVRLLERGGPDRDCCSLGNSGLISPSHFVPLAAPGMVSMGLRMMADPESPFWFRPRLDPAQWKWGYRFWRAATRERVERASPVLRDLLLESRAAYLRWAETLGNDFGLEAHGLLMLCRTAHALEDERQLAARASALGVEARVVTSAEISKLEPALEVDVVGGVFFPADAHLVPQRLVASLTRWAVEAGVSLEWNTEIRGWKQGHGGKIERVETSRGEIAADEFVLATGAAAENDLRGLSVDLPMQPGKGYSLTLAAPPRLPRLSSILVEGRVAVTPMLGALRVGGTMEIGARDLEIAPRRIAGILRSLHRYYPQLDADLFRGARRWAGLRPCTPDGLPYVGRVTRHPNLIVAAGHAMLGVSLAPATGRVVTDLLNGVASPTDRFELLAPDRWNASS